MPFFLQTLTIHQTFQTHPILQISRISALQTHPILQINQLQQALLIIQAIQVNIFFLTFLASLTPPIYQILQVNIIIPMLQTIQMS